jgi:hypothetical protein
MYLIPKFEFFSLFAAADCVQKKNHRIPLPAVLFIVNFYPEYSKSSGVVEINVHSSWQFNEDNLGFDIALLKLKTPVQFTEDFYPINLPPATGMIYTAYKSERKVLHTIEDQSSFDVPAKKIHTTDCILDDFTINRFLGDYQFCARQSEHIYSIAGHGQQYYDPKSKTLHGLISMVHITDVNYIKNNSLIVTDLGAHSDSVRNAICGDQK